MQNRTSARAGRVAFRLRVLVEKILLVLPVCMIFGSASGADDRVARCDEIDVFELESPDTSWTARMYGETCDLGLATSASVVVELVRDGYPTIAQTVLGMSMPPRKADWPELSWESPSRLVIQLPSRAEIGLQMASFQGVEIDVRFCPSDPNDRAQWLEYRAAYKNWIDETAEWVKNQQERDRNVPKPIRPQPPKSTSDGDCSP